jgi:hypothetical protein
MLIGYEPSTLPAAMAFANDWAGHAYSDDLRRLYPDVISFDWAGFHVFGRPIQAGELSSRLQGNTLLLWATTWEWVESYVWITNLKLEPLAQSGRDRLFRASIVPVPAGDRSQPFAGLLFVRGLPDLSIRFGGPPQDREALGPVLSAVFSGDGRPVVLSARFRNERPGPQRIDVRLNGEPLHSRVLEGSSGWVALDSPLEARPGLNEVTVAFEKTYGALDDRHTFRVPGYARSQIEGELTGIRFQHLRLVSGG